MSHAGRLVLLACLTCFLTTAVTTGALSATETERSVSVSVADDPAAYVGVTDRQERIVVNASAADPHTVEPLTLEENADLINPTVEVRASDAESGSAGLEVNRTRTVPENREFGTVHANVSCGDYRGEEPVTIGVRVAGDSTTVEFERSVTVVCGDG